MSDTPNTPASHPPTPPLPVLPPASGGDAHDHGAGHVPVGSKPGTGFRTAVAAGLLLVVLAAVGVWGWVVRHRAHAQLAADTAAAVAAPVPVQVVDVRRGAGRSVLTLPGEVRALHETTIYARTSGYVSTWKVDIGDRVEKDAEMARIETPELDDQLVAAEAKVKQAQSDIELARANVHFAELSYDRWAKAAPGGAVSAQDRDQKEAELKTSQARLNAATAAKELAEAEAQRLRTLTGFKVVRAPFKGTVTQRHVDLGDLVTAGSTTSTTPMYSIAAFDQVRVFCDVPQSAAHEVRVGMPATVEARAGGHRRLSFVGKVARTADAIDRSSRTLPVEVLVDNPDGAIKTGMYVDVSFETDRAAPPLQIPAAALAQRPTGPHVAVVGPDGTVRFQRIEIDRDL
ncbi:MAG TPA: efflux RND transporter periplasmic adaptor subunit, partial [Humisphaera sp.]